MPRSISVFGLGYVGSVSAACFAHKGNRILGVDLNSSKVDALNGGKSPIVEAKLEELVTEAHKNGRLRATTNTTTAILETEISLLCVGTPSQRNGKLDMSGVERVCEQIGEALREKKDFHWIVLRSTVLPGTTEKIVVPVLEKFKPKNNSERTAMEEAIDKAKETHDQAKEALNTVPKTEKKRKE